MPIDAQDWDKQYYLRVITRILDDMYLHEDGLFSKNKGRWLAERCIVFRFAHHLQNFFKNYNYHVDCDYNSSFELKVNDDGTRSWVNVSGKPIPYTDAHWNLKSICRFIDIIVHKRIARETNTICFEVKKWNNKTPEGMNKDRNNLKVLTSIYWYKFWFHLIFWRRRNKCKIDVYKNWEIDEE